MRIGHGYDVHAFCEGDHLVLGGVRIPHRCAVASHSDGDVLLHALCDAMLGALALGDIGQHFPDTDTQYENIDSRVLVKRTLDLLRARSCSVVNVDATIIIQAPKLAAHISVMRENIAQDLAIPYDCVSVKATTSEYLGFIGREEGLAAEVVVLVDSAA